MTNEEHRENIYKQFPCLKGSSHKFIGDPDPNYNCVAWVLEFTNKNWWPSGGSETGLPKCTDQELTCRDT